MNEPSIRSANLELLNRPLPKWPQMFTSGHSVTLDQAKEIIRRTDEFLIGGMGGNDHAWCRAMASRLRMPHLSAVHIPHVRDGVGISNIPWEERERAAVAWREAWGCVSTEYVSNNWLSTSFIYGPHGWCHPDGTIAFVDNVGKWPSVEEVFTEWVEIAQAFPFLRLASTLMDGESCDSAIPVVTIIVTNGDASLVEGDISHHHGYPAPTPRSDDSMMNLTQWTHECEHGPIPSEWYDEWAALATRLFPSTDVRP